MKKASELIERTIHVFIVACLTIILAWHTILKDEVKRYNEEYIDNTYGYLINRMSGDLEVIKNFDLPLKDSTDYDTSTNNKIRN